MILLILGFVIVALAVALISMQILISNDRKAQIQHTRNVFIKDIHVPCPGTIINYYKTCIRNSDEQHQFAFNDNQTMRFFARVQMDEKWGHLMAFHTLANKLCDESYIDRNHLSAFGLSKSIVERQRKKRESSPSALDETFARVLNVIFEDHYCNNFRNLDIEISLEEFEKANKTFGQESSVEDITLSIFPFVPSPQEWSGASITLSIPRLCGAEMERSQISFHKTYGNLMRQYLNLDDDRELAEDKPKEKENHDEALQSDE